MKRPVQPCHPQIGSLPSMSCRHLMLTTRSGRRGRAAENLVVWFLRQRGYRVVGRNINCALGEVDIIVLDTGARLKTYRFVEVKMRHGSARMPPEAAVTRSKQKKIYAASRYWILKNRPGRAVFHFDIVAIRWPNKGIPRIRWYKDAFFPEDPLGWKPS